MRPARGQGDSLRPDALPADAGGTDGSRYPLPVRRFVPGKTDFRGILWVENLCVAGVGAEVLVQVIDQRRIRHDLVIDAVFGSGVVLLFGVPPVDTRANDRGQRIGQKNTPGAICRILRGTGSDRVRGDVGRRFGQQVIRIPVANIDAKGPLSVALRLLLLAFTVAFGNGDVHQVRIGGAGS